MSTGARAPTTRREDGVRARARAGETRAFAEALGFLGVAPVGEAGFEDWAALRATLETRFNVAIGSGTRRRASEEEPDEDEEVMAELRAFYRPHGALLRDLIECMRADVGT